MFEQYPQSDVNAPILLHEGRVRVCGGDHLAEGSGVARLIWLPSPGIEIETDIETRPPAICLDSDSLTVELPGFETENVVVQETTVWPQGRVSAFVSRMESSCEEDLVSVGFQVVNFTDFITPGLSATPGDPTGITSGEQRRVDGEAATTPAVGPGRRFTCAAARLKYDGWLVDLVAVQDSREIFKKLKAGSGYAFTHVGQLTRMDGAPFTVRRAERILDSVGAFLSFARGAWCNLPIRWGYGANGDIVWCRFGSPVVDRWEQPLSWFDERHGELLPELFEAFCRMHNDEEGRDPLVLALHWYRQCNTQSSGMEGSVVLGMAALDLLSALIVVGRSRSMTAREHDNLRAAKKLRTLLQALNVPTRIPRRYEDLIAFAVNNGKSDSCDALAKLRNGFVHSNEERRKIVFGTEGKAATFDAWWLSLWYQELALLYLLDHQGSYANRTTERRVGQIEPVPWLEIHGNSGEETHKFWQKRRTSGP